jgi:predicted Zn-dependent protease
MHRSGIESFFARTALCVMLLLPAPHVTALNTELPDLGNSAGSLLTPKRERDLGKAFMRSVRRTEKVMDDPLLSDYIRDLGHRLLNASGAQGTPFYFFLIDDPQINAFAGPGGHIGFYTGLILTTETESELAAVMAHEIAHVTQQHLLRAWARPTGCTRATCRSTCKPTRSRPAARPTHSVARNASPTGRQRATSATS